MTTSDVAVRPGVLADLVPGTFIRDVVLVVASAALTGIAAQVSIPLPFTPVPISLQTFTVLLSGAALGPIRGGFGMGLYLVAGVAGIPWFAQQNSGYGFPSFGYIVGFVLAAILVGWLARRGYDRTVPGTIWIMVLGNLVIYVIGVTWLAIALEMNAITAISQGAWPFLIGDALKILLAAGLLPAAWWLARDRGQS